MEYNNEFNSLAEASKFTNINHAEISSVCNGRQKKAGNFIWVFKDEYEK